MTRGAMEEWLQRLVSTGPGGIAAYRVDVMGLANVRIHIRYRLRDAFRLARQARIAFGVECYFGRNGSVFAVYQVIGGMRPLWMRRRTM